ncbi:MAG: hypothetical protein IH997_16315, partial [Proteobacteria bacterium]|nr:hypothetical protein [Pseudomonadota bacterium]
MAGFRTAIAFVLSLLAAFAPALATARAPVVLAAASLQEALTAAAGKWSAKGHDRPVLSFAASSALARQVENSAAYRKVRVETLREDWPE